MAGQVCVLVLVAALVVASFALDLGAYLRHPRPRHGRRRRKRGKD